MPKLVIDERKMSEILYKFDNGHTVAMLAAEYSVHRVTIWRRISAFKNEGILGKRKILRSIKATGSDLTTIRRMAVDDPFATTDEIRANLSKTYHISTIARYLKRFGFKKYVSPRKFAINEQQREDREDVARRRALWNVRRWKKIVFTDESGIDNSGSQRRNVIRLRGQRFEQSLIYKAPNKSLRLNFFSYISQFGTGSLSFFKTMNSQVYCQVVTKMVDELKEKFGSDDFLIVHDNSAWHSSVETTNYLSRTGLSKYFIRLPTYSPDMNIIENTWGDLKSRVKYKCFINGQVRNRQEFIDLVQREWSSIPIEMVDNLYKSLPNRMRNILSANGHLTRY